MSSTYEIVESSIAALQEAHPLFVRHYDELTTNKGLMVLKPDWGRYFVLEEAGKLLVLVAYAGDDMVGYSVNLLDTNLHYADLAVCTNDLLFVLPEHRVSPLGLRLMKHTREGGRRSGAAMMVWHAKEHSPLSKLLSRKQLKVQDIIYSEPL
jgi:predicted GNAT superfamily acetyltransferase